MSSGRREHGKQRAQRISLDYFKRPDALERGKLIVAIGAVLATAGYLGGGLLLGKSEDVRYSHGPLAEAHAAWETQCDACHIPFQPIRRETWAASLSGGTLESEQKCLVCHSAPDHHAVRDPGEVRGCAECHRDHQGREARLSKVADKYCTECHGHLAAHALAGTPSEFRDVTRFDPDHHPEFRSIRPPGQPEPHDLGQLKFSHRRHMAPGLVGPGEKTEPTTLDRVPASRRSRYRVVDGQVQLECASCHQPGTGAAQAGGPPAHGLQGRSAGAYMLPVTYENHCRDCHSLTFDPNSKQKDLEPGSPELLPHALPPQQVSAFLQNSFSRRFFDEHPDWGRQAVPRRPLPNQPERPDMQLARAWVDERLQESNRFLRTKVCGQCHEFTGSPTEVTVVPTGVPAVWLRHARFDHAAHRAIDCRQCHARAYADHPQASNSQEDVLVPTLETCVQCHAPRSESPAAGGARFDCVECHRYHGVNHVQPGASGRAQGPAAKK